MLREMATTSSFARHLRKALDTRKMSVRQAARLWRPDRPELARRCINRYLSGTVTPGERLRDELAAAIGVDAKMLPIGTDNADHSDLMADLFAALQSVREIELRLSERERVA